MIYNVKNLFVELCGGLFPACNIQIWDTLDPVYEPDHKCWYGFYWGMMFESGQILEITQDLAEYHNHSENFSRIPDLEASTVVMWQNEESLKRDIHHGSNGPDFGWMFSTLDELKDHLIGLKKDWAVPVVKADIYADITGRPGLSFPWMNPKIA